MKRAEGKATIDCVLIVVTTQETTPRSFALNTATKLGVESETEVTDPIILKIKGAVKAKKGKKVVLTGTTLTLTDNVFTPELVQVLQGGVIKWWDDDTHTSSSTTPSEYGIAQYTPRNSGDITENTFFDTDVYSAVYNAAGQIVEYEKTTYPNCYGDPIAMTSEDDVFRVNEYTINSAPAEGEPAYDINYVDELPNVT